MSSLRPFHRIRFAGRLQSFDRFRALALAFALLAFLPVLSAAKSVDDYLHASADHIA